MAAEPGLGNAEAALPEGVLVAYYGDDFTGSTDVMEVLTFAGLPTVLFLELPDAPALARFSSSRAIGIAGTARSRSPEWMQVHLPPVLRALGDLNAPILQYKVCSTFDSSPTTGSIGRALELGLQASGRDWCALVVGAPALRRYQAFGNLFAAVDGVGHRLDRHPTMARHPVTPMTESDLRRHLAAQTEEAVALVDFVDLKQGRGEAAWRAARASGTRAVLFDVIDEASLAEAGRIVWQNRGAGVFAAASSGLEYALVAHWRAAGLLPPPPTPPARGPVERLLVVSGSCSPVTAGQIDRAVAQGFMPVPLDAVLIAGAGDASAEIARAIATARTALQAGRDVIVHSAGGAAGPSIAALDGRAQSDVAAALGEVLVEVTQACDMTRVVVAGGDTSGAAASRLGLYALQAVMPLDPGAPLCLGHRAAGPDLEIVLKGGQIGSPDFFSRVKSGQHR